MSAAPLSAGVTPQLIGFIKKLRIYFWFIFFPVKDHCSCQRAVDTVCLSQTKSTTQGQKQKEASIWCWIGGKLLLESESGSNGQETAEKTGRVAVTNLRVLEGKQDVETEFREASLQRSTLRIKNKLKRVGNHWPYTRPGLSECYSQLQPNEVSSVAIIHDTDIIIILESDDVSELTSLWQPLLPNGQSSSHVDSMVWSNGQNTNRELVCLCYY